MDPTISGGEKLKSIAILSPVFNEVESIDLFLNEITKIKVDLNKEYKVHVFLVDDGSNDGTFTRDFSDFSSFEIRVISLVRNFGHQSALLAGLQFVKNYDFVIVLDSDLQDPPKYIIDIVNLLKIGHDIVMTQRVNRYDSLFKKLFAFLYYRYVRFFFQSNMVLDSGDYWGVSRRILEKLLNKDSKKNIYFRGLLPNLSSNLRIVPITRNQRRFGHSKYGLNSMIKLAFSGIMNSNLGIWRIMTRFCLSVFFFQAFFVLAFNLILFVSSIPLFDFFNSLILIFLSTIVIAGAIVLLNTSFDKQNLGPAEIREVKTLS